jgi:hypothetical protein
MTLKINTDARPDEIEEVWFGDDGPYEFTSPKIAPLLSAMRKMQGMDDEKSGVLALDMQEQWLERGFGPDQWKRIQGRIDDDADALDSWHLMQVFEALFEKVSGRPPTLPGG